MVVSKAKSLCSSGIGYAQLASFMARGSESTMVGDGFRRENAGNPEEGGEDAPPRENETQSQTHARRETLRMPLPIFFASHPHEREWSRVRRWILVVGLRERKV